MDLNLSEIKYFLEVCRTGNMTKAASRLGIAQPSLSLAIQKLENQLGAELFFRSRKGVELSIPGKKLLSQSQALIEMWEQVKSSTMSSANEATGMIRLGCHPSVALYTLPHFMPNFLKDNPGIHMELQHDISRVITQKVIDFQLEMGIVVNPQKNPDLIIQKLLEDEVTLWSHKKTDIQSLKKSSEILITHADLLQSEWLMKALKKKSINFDRVVTSSSLEVIRELTHAKLGIAILPERVAKRIPQADLHRVQGAPVFNDEISLVYRVENKNIVCIQEAKKAILANLS